MRHTESTITDAIRAYAADAVAFARRRFDIHLDYSEQSLSAVDRILADYTQSRLVVPDQLNPSEQDELWTFCKMLGGYLDSAAKSGGLIFVRQNGLIHG